MWAHGLAIEGRWSLNASHGYVPSHGAKTLVVSSKQGDLTEFSAGLIARTMGDTVITISLRGNDFIQWRGRAGGTICFICKVKNRDAQDFCCCIVNGKEILMLRMETGSASSSASSTPRSVVAVIKDLKHDVKALQDQVEAIDTEGDRRLENMDKDLAYLRKKINREVRRSENEVIGLIAELEIKVDKLTLKLVKHEAPPNPGSPSSFDAKFN